MTVRTRYPPPGRGPAANVPPSIAARSRIPVVPRPAPGVAGPAHAEVHLHYGEQLEITVTDDGRGAAAVMTGTAPPGAGRGTTGMRERVAMLGGRFTAGPQSGGGFRVHAVIPRPGTRPAAMKGGS